MAYAGHQFGGYSPRLGDGRALLIGEQMTPDGERVDLHLKGTGRTPYSRGGDGKAALGPMLREFLFAEALHALHIPTARALAVVGTGELVARDSQLPGAVLTRVAASHLRVGTFEYTVRLGDTDVLRRLTDYAIERHYPDAADSADPALGLLAAVVDAQASLVAKWMAVGFIHGVMNTDNVTIGGETIDYGPCAFMDRYDPATVFSSIDHGGRYAYGNQPTITGWNLARLAESLIPVVVGDTEESVAAVTAVLDSYPDTFQQHWLAEMRKKLGLGDAAPAAGDAALVDDLLTILSEQQADYTSVFRALANHLRQVEGALESTERWASALGAGDRQPGEMADAMDAVNPVYVPRNHLVDAAL
ncbi:UNVERIFIED_CONTAM: hypothetical protein GTU68_047910, partial [Idotea baltica]|nr:hypothetical protein [Idotea baltica]